MVLHEHKASPQSQPRTRRTGFTPELLSTPFSQVFFLAFLTELTRHDHSSAALLAHAQGNTEFFRPWTLFAEQVQVPRVLMRAPRAPSNPALYRRTHRIVIQTALSTTRYLRMRGYLTQRTVQ